MNADGTMRYVWIVFDDAEVKAVCANADEADFAYEALYMKATDAEVPGLHIERFALLGDTSEDGLTSWLEDDESDEDEDEDESKDQS